MNRKKFLKKAALTALAGAIAPQLIKGNSSKDNLSNARKAKDTVGFNHLPNKEYKTMNTVIHKAETRGHANHGWLNSHHTFSFANYHNPERMNFGVLRVLNDDVVAGGKGFGTHPHSNMEIISIPLEGDLEHKDSMGNTTLIKQGDIQVMSAGTGVYHSEYNKNKDQEVKFLQIWVYPNEQEVDPRYDQIALADLEKENEFYQVLSPNKGDDGVWVHQNTWFSLGKFTEETNTSYSIKSNENGVYAFVLEGEVDIEGEKLGKRDGMGIWDTDNISINASEGTKILLMDVPMSL